VPFELVPPGTKFDFLGKWKICTAISSLVILIGLVGLWKPGAKMGVDFAGGTEMQVRFTGEVPADAQERIRNVMESLGLPSDGVVRFGGEANDFVLKFPGERRLDSAAPGAEVEASERGAITAETDLILKLESALREQVGPMQVERVEFVGPKVGEDLRRNGLNAIGISCLLLMVYIAFRFTPRFAPGAVVALIHDVAVTSAVWIVFQLEFDLRVLAALLAVLGYSLNDTIVVYDRIRENLALHTRSDLVDVLNRSVNETLSRTLLTGVTSIVAVLALLVFGGDVVRPFALAMLIGIVVGTYSSVYIASPTLLALEHWRARSAAGTAGRARAAKPERAGPAGAASRKP
jgi:preprotein translocase subunit SecF